MSEYWVSKKKYYCKYCEIYIADDAPSRQQHENGLRHKGNRERFIRGLYKDGEKRKKDLDEEKREMARVEMAAQAAFSQDVSAGRAKAAAPVASTSNSSKKLPQKPSNPFANYSTAASLGYTDPDAERIAAEKERHRMQGVAGTWEVVQPSSQQPQELEVQLDEKGVKRPADARVDEEDTRQFKLRKKTLGTGLGEIYDPGLITLKPKTKAAPAEEGTSSLTPFSTTPAVIPSTSDSAPKATNVPKLGKLQWKRPGERTEKNEEEEVQLRNQDAEEEKPSLDEPTLTELKDEPKIESSNTDPPLKAEAVEPSIPPPAGGSLFRKRKAPVGGGRRQPA